ncbi:DUF4340 domain-containing protein [Candidatus Sumerlaeota bacterium]|nr:DUF4340 domain-containing protein [Candidatus Sumerlaeota bacterium]
MNRQTIIVLIVAAVMVALLLVFENPFKRRPVGPQRDEKVELFVPIPEEQCSRIELSGLGTSATLVRKDREWFTNDGFRADAEAIGLLFRAIERFGAPELISINPNALPLYRLDQISGIRLLMLDANGRQQVDLVLGELERDFVYMPIRRTRDTNVYRVRGMLVPMLRQYQQWQWRDTTIVRFEPESVRRVAVAQTGNSYAIERSTTDQTWMFTEPTSGPADNAKVLEWLNRFSRLGSQGAAELEPPASPDMLTTFGLTPPRSAISITLDSGASYTVLFGDKKRDADQYYAKRADQPQLYRLPAWIHDQALATSATLRPAPAPVETATTLPAVTTGPARVISPVKTPSATTSPPVSSPPPPKAKSP